MSKLPLREAHSNVLLSQNHARRATNNRSTGTHSRQPGNLQAKANDSSPVKKLNIIQQLAHAHSTPTRSKPPLAPQKKLPIQRKKWAQIDGDLIDPDTLEPYEGSDAPELRDGDVWDDETNEVTHFQDRMGAIFAQDDEHVADRDDHEALIAQFETLGREGGLLMHAVAAGEEVESLSFLVEQGKTLDEIRMGDYRTKLLSYIRSDLTMKTFAFRRFGLLVDWRRVWNIIGTKGVEHPMGAGGTLRLTDPTIFEEDQQSSREALDGEASFGETGGRMGGMGSALNQMAERQNALKKTKSVSNWNEILAFNAVTAGVVGVLWIRDETSSAQTEDHNVFFTDERKLQLFKEFTAKTGMKTMPIYLYTHLGNPQGAERTEARARLGRKGASSLVLLENYAPPSDVAMASASKTDGGAASALGAGGERVAGDETHGAQQVATFETGASVRVRYHLHYDVLGVVVGVAGSRVQVRLDRCVVPGTTEPFESDHTRIVLNEVMTWDATALESESG